MTLIEFTDTNDHRFFINPSFIFRVVASKEGTALETSIPPLPSDKYFVRTFIVKDDIDTAVKKLREASAA